MTDRLPAIATKLAGALRLMPCRCITIGDWPLFKAEAAGTPEKPGKPGKHTPRTCGRCVALDEYDAYVSIVQLPKVKT